MNGRRRLAVAIALAVLSIGLQCEASGAASDLLLDLEPTASDGMGASIHPKQYWVRGGRLLSVMPPLWRASEADSWQSGDPTVSGRFAVPASNVKNGRLRVEIQYLTLFFPHPHRAWVSVDVKKPLVNARTLFMYEGQQWARVEEDAGKTALVFDETTDEVAKVTYAIDGGKATALPMGVSRVELTEKPTTYLVSITMIDGSLHEQRISRDESGEWKTDWKRSR